MDRRAHLLEANHQSICGKGLQDWRCHGIDQGFEQLILALSAHPLPEPANLPIIYGIGKIIASGGCGKIVKDPRLHLVATAQRSLFLPYPMTALEPEPPIRILSTPNLRSGKRRTHSRRSELLMRSTASSMRAWGTVRAIRKKPSPFLPKPFPGVTTMPT